MGTLSRLHDFETDRDATPPVLISATKMDAELDQLITESNAQDVRLDTAEAAGHVSTADLAADAVTGAKIADNAIDSEHYTDGSIDNAHIADDAIDSEHYVDGSIDTAHLAADAVDGTKLADNAVDSEHYTDGSIDSVHLSADCVVSTKVADDSLVNADINSSAAIDATKIHDGSISNTEFGYLNNAASNLQGQIDGITAGVVSTVNDDVFRIRDDGDSSKQIAFQASGISTSTIRTITMPDENVTLGEGGVVSTNGKFFSNYNTISGSVTTTTTTTENMFLMGQMSVADTYTWTIAGNGVLTII